MLVGHSLAASEAFLKLLDAANGPIRPDHHLKTPKTFRNLQQEGDNDEEHEKFLLNMEKMDQIHERMVNCVENEMQIAFKQNVKKFKDIVQQCAGPKFRAIHSFLAKVDVISKETLRRPLQHLLKMDECKKRTSQCLYLLELANFFTGKNYVVVQSIEFNKDSILETVDQDLFDAVFQKLMPIMHDFDVLQERLRKEVLFVREFFDSKEQELDNFRMGKGKKERVLEETKTVM